MPTIPLRSLGKLGVITDLNPFDLPPEAVSDARNVRFADGRITNAHVYRQALASPSGGTPVFAFSILKTNNPDILGYVTLDGKVFHSVSGIITEVTKTSGFTPANSTAVRSFCHLQGVYYVNQEDRVPWYFNSASTDYDNLPNWTSTHRCKVLRPFKDHLVALNITKTSSVYPNMVKWSNIALYDAVPDSWDPADTTKSAGENTIAEIQTDILDGLQLRNSFIVYALDQVWIMEYSGGPDVFQFFKAFGDRGILGTNCVVEVDGTHFVFDDDDIYIHDGVSPPKSICDSRIRKHLFRNIDLSKRSVCFAYHDVVANEIWFCYNTLDGDVKWLGGDCTYCNEAAVYNYVSDSWTFYDLPNVSSMASVDWQDSLDYSEMTSVTYENVGTNYADMIGNAARGTYAFSITTTGLTATRMLNVDSGLGAQQPFPASSECSVVPYAERLGLDLDEVVEELRTYKNYRAIYPQMGADSSVTVSFKFGGCDFPMQDIEWDALQEYDPFTEYKVDTRARGRYLAWYVEGHNSNDYSLSGFDLDMQAVSRR
jgi:hypothetical protein